MTNVGGRMRINSSVPRGDSKSFSVALPSSVWSAGSTLFFAMKPAVDDDPLDTEAVVVKSMTDADIVSQDSDTVNYVLAFVPADTFYLEPATYVAEIQWVSADRTAVQTFPDPNEYVWLVAVAGDVNRRTA